MGTHDFYKNVKNSAAGFVVDKILSLGAGFAVLVLGSIFLPVTDIVFRLYVHWTSFLETYIYYCLAIFISTIIFWISVWRSPLMRIALPYVISMIAIIVSGLMRSGVLIPNIISIQFLLLFGGIVMLCEALVIHAIVLVYDFGKKIFYRQAAPDSCALDQ